MMDEDNMTMAGSGRSFSAATLLLEPTDPSMPTVADRQVAGCDAEVQANVMTLGSQLRLLYCSMQSYANFWQSNA